MRTMSKTFKTLLGGGSILVLSLLAISHAGAQSCVAPPSGLVSWWPGDGNFNDIADANTGIDAGGTTFTTGKVGQAFNFNGFPNANSFVTVGSNNMLPSSNQLTIDAWVKPDFSQQNALDTVLTKRDGCGNFGISYNLGVVKFDPAFGGGHAGRPIGQLFLTMSASTGSPNIVADSGTTVVPNDGQFHHVAGTYDGFTSTMNIYLDAQLVGQASRTGPILGTTSAPVISHHGGTCPQRAAAAIDEVEFFDRALSQSEIQSIVDAGSAGKCKGTAPIANAGLDQTVNEGDVVTLDGSGSSDPDGDALTFQWTQVAGPSVTLSDPSAQQPTFVAPNVPRSGATLTFQLTVSDGEQTSDPDTVDITVKDVNNLPVADAGDDQTLQEGSPVTLDGSNSFDFDSDPLTYSWIQTSGPSVTLSGANTAQPSFTAPLVGPAGAMLTFELTVDDGIATDTDTVDVVISNVNQTPIANAGADQTKHEGTLVTLDGTASSDPDADPLTYTWTQVSGPSVTLSDPNSPTPTFTAPLVSPGGATLEFELNVNDGALDSDPDDVVTVTVLDINDPPACDLAQASPDLLWPPNHKLLTVGITNVADPNNNQLTLTVTGVTQDEPVNGVGDGDTGPDAVLQGDKVLLRAERAGTGNGRVYEVSFTADDGLGGSCTGAVMVCVPQDRRPGTVCVDDGQLHDS